MWFMSLDFWAWVTRGRPWGAVGLEEHSLGCLGPHSHRVCDFSQQHTRQVAGENVTLGGGDSLVGEALAAQL